MSERPLDGVLVPNVALDRSSPVPLYFQVATRLQEQIEGGELPVGGRLENEVELADRLGVSRPTMRKAIGYLVERGMLVRRRGVGTQIVHPKVRRPVELTSLYDDLAKTGRAPRTEIRSLEVGPATDAVAETLGIPPGTPVTTIERIRYAGDEPLAIMHNAVPVDVVGCRPRTWSGAGSTSCCAPPGECRGSRTRWWGRRRPPRWRPACSATPRGAPMLDDDPHGLGRERARASSTARTSTGRAATPSSSR